MRAAAPSNVCRIGIEYGLVVSLAVLRKRVDYVRIRLVTIGLESIHDHAKAAIGHDGALEGSFGLKPENNLILFVDVSRPVRRDGARDL